MPKPGGPSAVLFSAGSRDCTALLEGACLGLHAAKFERECHFSGLAYTNSKKTFTLWDRGFDP